MSQTLLREHKPRKAPKQFYITNWDKYKIPVPVDANIMKKILERIALYKTLQYCPFKYMSDCLDKNTDYIIEKIISEVISEYNMKHY